MPLSTQRFPLPASTFQIKTKFKEEFPQTRAFTATLLNPNKNRATVTVTLIYSKHGKKNLRESISAG